MTEDEKLADAVRLELRWARRFARQASRDLNLAIRDTAYFVEHNEIAVGGRNPNKPQQLGILVALRERLRACRAKNVERQAKLKAAEAAARGLTSDDVEDEGKPLGY